MISRFTNKVVQYPGEIHRGALALLIEMPHIPGEIGLRSPCTNLIR